jgi:predicted GTPase
MNDQLAISFVETLTRKLEEISKQRLVFFVVGRAGWGKSSTVNSLIGEYKCIVHDNEPATTEVTKLDFVMNDVKCTIFDTPGLCDGSGNDQTYIQMISSKVRNPDSMLYVNRLDETRLTDNDTRIIKIISEALGVKVWEKAVIVFTFSNNINKSEYSEKLEKRTEMIRQAIASYIQNTEVANQIPAVPIDNKSKTTPDGKEWLGEFFTVLVDRIDPNRLICFLSMFTPSIKERTNFSNKQKEIIRTKFVSAVLQSAAAGIGIASIVAGIVNAPVTLCFAGGGIVGTLIGAWLSKSDE